MTKVLHRHIYKPSAFGGTTNTTLCGRVDNSGDYNIADTDSAVSCHFCRQILDGKTKNFNEKWMDFTPE